MRISKQCQDLFWKYREGKISLKELNEEMDRLGDKQESLDFEGGVDHEKDHK